MLWNWHLVVSPERVIKWLPGSFAFLSVLLIISIIGPLKKQQQQNITKGSFMWISGNVTFAYLCPGPQPDDLGNSNGQIDSMDLVDLEEPTVKEELPHRTVVLRRGLALAAMLLILAAGITINLLITNLVTWTWTKPVVFSLVTHGSAQYGTDICTAGCHRAQ